VRYEIWLGDHYSHFERGVAHMPDGRSLPVKSWIQPATYGSDSLYLADEVSYTFSDFPVRWLIGPALLEIYCWDSEVSKIRLHNGSSKPIRIDGFQTLRSGDSIEIQRER